MKNSRTELTRLFLIGGLSVIGGFAGAGAASVVAVLAAGSMSKTRGDEFVAGSGPLVLSGGVLGLAGGFMLALLLFRKRAASAQAKFERRYIGAGGLWAVYSGFPMFFVALCMMLGYETLAHMTGEGAAPYVGLFVFMVIVGVSLYFFDRIPRSLILPIGFLGWMLLVGFACWYSLLGPGSLGHH